MSRHLADVDSTMDRLRKTSILHRLTRADDRCPKLAARTAAGEELLASSLRSLTMTAAVLDVPAANRSHPGLRDRLQRALPEMDASIFGITSMLASTSEADRAAMNRYLREDPKAGPRICEEFDLAARRVGLPLARRLKFRGMMTDVAWRLKQQPASLIIDEIVEKVEKVARRHGQSEELKRHFTAAAANDMLWRQDALVASATTYDGSGAAPTTPAPAATSPVQAPTPLPLEPERKPGSSAITAGAYMFGIGFAVGAIGAILIATPALPVGLGLATLGVLAIVVGLFTLIIGGIIRAAS